jgi:uncharacterized protein YcbK (DUF882 family)
MAAKPHSRLPEIRLAARRCFLQRAASCAGLLVVPFGGAFAESYANRSLSFVHTHTGESLSVNYCSDGAYAGSCLAQLNHLLRDFRTGEAHTIDPQLLDILFNLQVMADRSAVFEIISGYRSPLTNASLRQHSHGVAEHSLHMEGRALDIRMSDYSTRKVRDYAMSLQHGGVGFYAGSDFVHVDTGRVRYWQG